MEEKNKNEVPQVLILNKVFDGAYTEKEGNIAHEIIDFFKADNGKIYFYNNPYGQCPDNIFVSKDYKKSTQKNKTNYAVRYILICSPSKIKRKDVDNGYISQFYIKYVAEIKEILHKESRSKDIDTLEKTRDFIKKEIIDKRDIRYGGKKLYNIYKNDTSLLLTFEVKNVWEPINDNLISIDTIEYRYQRNKGYIYSDKHSMDYNNILKLIENKSLWKKVNRKKLNRKKITTTYNKKTFLNLIMKTDSEECYTNMLHSVLSVPKMMDKFCKEFAPNKTIAKSFDCSVEREKVINGGRMDICADNKEQRVIIENKIFSGLNGVNEEDKISQLNYYYTWGTENKYSAPYCFIACPDFRAKEIKAEINNNCPDMSEVFEIVEYSKIAKFIENNKKQFEKEKYIYIKYVDEIIDIFKNYSYKDKNEFFEKLFLNAINKC